MKSTENTSKIPSTGRIGRFGRFGRIVKDKTIEESYLRIMDKSDKYDKYKPEKKAVWWNNAIIRLENEIGTENAIKVMRTCGSICCGQGQRKTAKRLMQESSSIEDFLNKLSNYEVKDGELEYKMINETTIIGKHNK